MISKNLNKSPEKDNINLASNIGNKNQWNYTENCYIHQCSRM